jgi:hypothetical protein
MKYEITQINISSERVIFEEIIGENNEIQKIPTNEYEVDITIGLKHIDNFIPEFSKTISVKSNNSQTGFEVDEQRQQIVTDYMTQINS